MKYLHIGSDRFNKSLFRPVSEYLPMKPFGGFWSSPIGDSYYTWELWNQTSNFIEDIQNQPRFEFELKATTRVLTIDSINSYKELLKNYGVTSRIIPREKTINWEQLTNDYDAILVLISKCSELYFLLYGWDCDSLLVLNPDCVQVEATD